MEVSVIGSSQVNLGRNNDTGLFSFSKNLNPKICKFKKTYLKGFSFGKNQSLPWLSKSAVGFALRASASDPTVISAISTRTKPIDNVKLFVGLPLDTISKSNTINHVRAIAMGLKSLKSVGVDGVELPVWWGIAEKEAMGKYEWTGYLALAEMVRKSGLELHISLCFHACEDCKIPLPEWVTRVGEEEPDIYFTDRLGQQYEDCVSLAVDDVPVLNGKTPVEVYREFCESFKSAFSPFLGSTIMGISIGLGPDGKLQYPSHHHAPKYNGHHGAREIAGEFQCYDKHMLENLRNHAEKHGDPQWGLAGPHNADNGFFLSWYSDQLISHGDRILSLAASTFKDASITVSGKVPLTHSWYKMRSHALELTAGFYNTADRDVYKEVAKIFSKNNCKMITSSSCKTHGAEVLRKKPFISGVSRGFEQVGENLRDGNATVEMFTYRRMGAYFFSPEHFYMFARFVRGLKQPVWSLDEVLVGEGDDIGSVPGSSRLRMQTA